MGVMYDLLKRFGRIFCRSCSIMGVMLTRKTVWVKQWCRGWRQMGMRFCAPCWGRTGSHVAGCMYCTCTGTYMYWFNKYRDTHFWFRILARVMTSSNAWIRCAHNVLNGIPVKAENHNKALLSVANGKDISPWFLWFNKRLAYKITGRGVPRLILWCRKEELKRGGSISFASSSGFELEKACQFLLVLTVQCGTYSTVALYERYGRLGRLLVRGWNLAVYLNSHGNFILSW